jgi:hypothetical protein
MRFKNKLGVVILGLLCQLLFFAPGSLESLRARDSSSEYIVVLPASLPEKEHLILVSLLPVTVEAKIVGAVAVYDDATSARTADYLELYDNAGQVVAIGWFDRFGIERMAIDRGLLEDQDELKGVFVLVLKGDSA